jgi:hypothetical protein
LTIGAAADSVCADHKATNSKDDRFPLHVAKQVQATLLSGDLVDACMKLFEFRFPRARQTFRQAGFFLPSTHHTTDQENR